MWTNADAVIDYLLFAKQYISKCEERHGVEAVESLLDSCHALMSHGVDRYKHPQKLSIQEEAIRQQNREEYLQSQVNDLWRTIPASEQDLKGNKKQHFPEEPQENILYFLEKNAPLLEPWQREVIRITRKIAQYFYPQGQTKVMNEGWACFWHHTILNAMYDEGLVTDEFMLEILQSHTNVVYQPPFNSPHFSGINPYALGYNMMQDVKRICENPTDEDKQWFPYLANTDWLTSLDYSMRNFKDESYISQYLSPNMMRELKLFHIRDDDKMSELLISDIHNTPGYRGIRESLSKQYNLGYLDPDIQIYDVNIEGDRSLTLHHMQHNRRPLGIDSAEVLKHLHQLWQFPVKIKSFNEKNELVKVLHCPEKPKKKETKTRS